LIEYMLGFELDAPTHTITWRISRLERHGLQNLRFGGFETDLLCEARNSPGDPCQITVKSGGPFVLKVVVGGRTLVKQVQAGTQSFTAPGEQGGR